MHEPPHRRVRRLGRIAPVKTTGRSGRCWQVSSPLQPVPADDLRGAILRQVAAGQGARGEQVTASLEGVSLTTGSLAPGATVPVEAGLKMISSKPSMTRARVDLPHPEGPSSTVICPGSMVRSSW